MRRRGSSCSADSSRATGPKPASTFLTASLSSSRLAIGVLVIGLVLGLAVGGPASAESPTAVAEDLAIDGVYVAPGRADIDETMIAESIREARARGLRLVVVAPIDPQPSAEAFARRVLEASDADAALVFPPEGGLEGHVIDELESASLRALTAGRSKATPQDAVEAFTVELLTEPDRSVPPIVGQLARGVLVLAILLAGAVAIEQLLRRMFPKKRVMVADGDSRQSGEPERERDAAGHR